MAMLVQEQLYAIYKYYVNCKCSIRSICFNSINID